MCDISSLDFLNPVQSYQLLWFILQAEQDPAPGGI